MREFESPTTNEDFRLNAFGTTWTLRNDDGSIIPDATTPPAMAPALWRNLPEVASATRVFPNWGRK